MPSLGEKRRERDREIFGCFGTTLVAATTLQKVFWILGHKNTAFTNALISVRKLELREPIHMGLNEQESVDLLIQRSPSIL